MPITKKKDTTGTSVQTSSRKPWKKKTPVQILLDQVDKLEEEIRKDEEALNQKKEQLKKFAEARKLFEGK